MKRNPKKPHSEDLFSMDVFRERKIFSLIFFKERANGRNEGIDESARIHSDKIKLSRSFQNGEVGPNGSIS